MSETERDPMLRGIETLFGDLAEEEPTGEQPLIASAASRARWAAEHPAGAADAPTARPAPERLEPLTAAAIEEIFTRPVTVTADPPAVPPRPPLPPSVARPDARRLRPTRRLIAIASSAVAVVLVVIGVALVLNLVETQKQHEQALQDHAAAEDALAAAYLTAEQAHERVTTAIAASLENATQAETALGILPGYVDETALLAASDATRAYRAGLEAVTPEPLPSPAAVDASDKSTDEITASARAARAQVSDLEKTAESLSTALVQVGELDGAFLQSMAVLGAAFPDAAETALEAALDADEELQTAVTEAASAVPAAQAAGGVGTTEMLAYPPAVDALRADQREKDEESGRTQEPPASDSAPPAATDPIDTP